MREMALLNSYEKHPDGSGIAATSVIGRGRGAPAPIIRVGIPPPGAIILNGQQPMAIRGRGIFQTYGNIFKESIFDQFTIILLHSNFSTKSYCTWKTRYSSYHFTTACCTSSRPLCKCINILCLYILFYCLSRTKFY